MGKKVEILKKGIHPKFTKSVVTCACGNSFESASVREKLHVDIFYSGKQKLIETGGRVDKFNKRFGIK